MDRRVEETDIGPGYRVYYTIRGTRRRRLAGGSKSTQNRGIANAIRLALNYEE